MRLTLILLLYGACGFAQSENRLTIEDIKKFALANNLGIKVAEADINEVKAQTLQKRSNSFPKLSFIAGPELKTQENKTENNTLGYLEGKWNLFRGSQDRLEVEISELNEQLAQSKKNKVHFEIELEIEKLFYQYLFKATKIQLYQKSVELNEKHKQLIRQKSTSGMASQADIMEFELRDSLLKSEISALTQEKSEVKQGLIRLMGPNFSGNFEPFGELPHKHLKRSLSEFLEQINATSENVKSASLSAATGSLGTKYAIFSWLPTVDAEVKYGRLPIDSAENYPAFEGALLLRWEFFSGFETSGKVSEARAKAQRLDLEFRQRLLTSMTEAEINYSRLNSIQDRIHVENGNEVKAEKYYKAVLGEYRRGVKNGADLKAAEELLLLSRTRNADFRYQFIENIIQLEKSLGLFIETELHQ